MTVEQLKKEFDTKLEKLQQCFVSLENKLLIEQATHNVKNKEVQFLGSAETISLEELKATVKVLENYKRQGFKNVKL